MNPSLQFTSKSDEWATPQWLFDELDAEFHFDLDVCALPENAKCERFYTPDDNGLAQPWDGDAIWCNPPYGRRVGKWVAKAEEAWRDGKTVVMLLFAKTDTKWFHDHIYGRAEIRFIKGRLRFGGAQLNAPYPSMVVVFSGKEEQDGH